MSGHAAHRPGVVVVHRPAVHLAPVGAALGRRVDPARTRPLPDRQPPGLDEEGVLETERPGHPVLEEPVERRPTDPFEEKTERQEGWIPVEGSSARRRLERLLPERFLQDLPPPGEGVPQVPGSPIGRQEGLPRHRVRGGSLEPWPPPGQPARMRQQVPHGHPILPGAPFAETREPVHDRRVEPDPALLHEECGEGPGGDDLGERGHVEQKRRPGVRRAGVRRPGDRRPGDLSTSGRMQDLPVPEHRRVPGRRHARRDREPNPHVVAPCSKTSRGGPSPGWRGATTVTIDPNGRA